MRSSFSLGTHSGSFQIMEANVSACIRTIKYPNEVYFQQPFDTSFVCLTVGVFLRRRAKLEDSWLWGAQNHNPISPHNKTKTKLC